MLLSSHVSPHSLPQYFLPSNFKILLHSSAGLKALPSTLFTAASFLDSSGLQQWSYGFNLHPAAMLNFFPTRYTKIYHLRIAHEKKKKLVWEITSKKKPYFLQICYNFATLWQTTKHILLIGQSENHSISISIVNIVNGSNFFASYNHFLTIFTKPVIY